VYVVGLEVSIRIPDAHSLKDRRQVVRALLDGARHRFSVSVAEVGGQDTWQLATLGFAVVASEAHVAEELVDAIDRFIWSHPNIEILDTNVRWLD
jgi:uncharacterized protein YlxP (DUF503 family)